MVDPLLAGTSAGKGSNEKWRGAVLTSSRAIGIEIAAKRLIALEADRTTDPPSIRVAISGPVLSTGPGNSLRTLLGEEGVTARVVHLVLSDCDSLHRLQLLPPMTATERQLFLERELRRELGGPSLLGYKIVRRAETVPPKDEVLVAAVTRDQADETLAGLIAAGLVPRLVTTAPLALARAAETLVPSSSDRARAVAHWGFRGLTVAVVAEGTLKFAREIPHFPGLDASDWFVTEFQRSILQYTQNVKGGAIGSVVVGSVDARFERALPGVEARLGLPLLNLNEAVRALLPEGTEELTSLTSGAFVLPFGAAVLSPKETANLLPLSIFVQRRAALLKRGTGAAAALLVFSLGYAAWSAAQQVTTYRAALARLTAQKRALLAERAQVDRIKQEREIQYQRIGLLKVNPIGAPPVADVFKEISRVAPGGLRLERLVLGRDETGFKVRLTGGVESTDLAQAQREFNGFYFGLQGSPFFSDVVFNSPAHPAPPSGVAVPGPAKKLDFELDLRLREIK